MIRCHQSFWCIIWESGSFPDIRISGVLFILNYQTKFRSHGACVQPIQANFDEKVWGPVWLVFCLENSVYCLLSMSIMVQEGVQRLVLSIKFDKS